MNSEEIELRKLLYRAVRELSYIQCVELEGDHSLCATPEGNSIVEEGMKLLGVNDLSVDSYRWHPADCKHVWLAPENYHTQKCRDCGANRRTVE